MHQDEKNLIQSIYLHLENDEPDNAVFVCFRLARLMKDYFNTGLFLRELNPDEKQLYSAFYDEFKHLRKEAQKSLWEITGHHWIEERTVSFPFIEERPEANMIAMGIGVLQKDRRSLSQSISDLKVPEGMGTLDTAAFTDKYERQKSAFRLKMAAETEIIERIRTRCLNYASMMERRIGLQEKTHEFLLDVQNVVLNYFSGVSKDVFQKLEKATELAMSKKTEDFALLLTSVRRAIKAVADYFYPPTESAVRCMDGRERQMGSEQYLNRLEEFCRQSFETSSSNNLLKAELEYFVTFARKINDLASKGVHATANRQEARQGLVGLYMLLYNLIQKLEFKDSTE